MRFSSSAVLFVAVLLVAFANANEVMLDGDAIPGQLFDATQTSNFTLKLPVVSGTVQWASITVYTLNTFTYAGYDWEPSTDPLESIWAVFTYSYNEYYTAPATVYPTQSVQVGNYPAGAGETEVVLDISVQCPNLPAGQNCTFTISASSVVELISAQYSLGNGVYQASGSIRPGQRPYFHAQTTDRSQMYFETCNSTGFNPLPLAYIQGDTDFYPAYYENLYFPCGEANNSMLVVNNTATSYHQVCPTFVYFADGVDIGFGLDIMQWWDYPTRGATGGSVEYTIIVYTEDELIFAWEAAVPLQADSYINPVNASISGTDLVVTFTLPMLTLSRSVPSDSSYSIFVDNQLVSTERERVYSGRYMNDACYLLDSAASMLFESFSIDDLTPKTGETSVTLLNFFTTNYTAPGLDDIYHVNVVMNSPTYGAVAYSFTEIPYYSAPANSSSSSNSGGLSTGDIIGLVTAILAVIILVVAIVVVLTIFIYMKRRRETYIDYM